MEKLTKKQAVVLSGFTGILHGSFSDFHEDVEKRMNFPVFTHQFADKDFVAKVKELYREDFIAMQPE
jgi:hypothetical protein